jgi:acetyl esterase/lipase
VAGKPDAEDPIERVSSRPDYLVLGYPWIEAVSGPNAIYVERCKKSYAADKCEAIRNTYSPELSVTKETPPTFWYHTFNDQSVPVEQGLRFYEALVKAGVPSEAHIFPNGPHGVGLGNNDAVLDQWPNLLENWLRAQGLLTAAKPAAKP